MAGVVVIGGCDKLDKMFFAIEILGEMSFRTSLLGGYQGGLRLFNARMVHIDPAPKLKICWFSGG